MSSKSGCIWHSSKMALLDNLPEGSCGTLLLLKKLKIFFKKVSIFLISGLALVNGLALVK